MKPVDRKEILQFLESKVEANLQEAIRVFQNLDEETLLRPSNSGGWSIAQCLEHLNSYGHYYLPLIKNRIENAPAIAVSGNFKSTWLGNRFIRMMDPATSTKKYKAFKDHIPAPDVDAHAAVAEFIRQQEVLLHWINASATVDLNSLRIPISISKWIKLKLGDVLQFLVAHNERHLQQAKRNLEDII